MLFASFRTASGIYGGCFNRFAAFVTGGQYCHSEFLFMWTEEEVQLALVSCPNWLTMLKLSDPTFTSGSRVCVCVDVSWGGKVQYRLLETLADDLYWQIPTTCSIRIPCSLQEEMALLKWLYRERNKDYDRFGALTSVIPLRRSQSHYDTYFCSQLMACGLQGILRFDNPAAETPNSLEAKLRSMYGSSNGTLETLQP